MKIEYCCEKCGRKFTEKAACEAHESACMSIDPVELIGWHDLKYSKIINGGTRPELVYIRYADGMIGEYYRAMTYAAECESKLNIHYMPT